MKRLLFLLFLPILLFGQDPYRDKGAVTLRYGYDSTATTLILRYGDGAKLPNPATDTSFNLIWWDNTKLFSGYRYQFPQDDPSFEIVRVRGRSGDTLQYILRGQGRTTAKNHNTSGATYRMMMVWSELYLSDLEEAIADIELAGGVTPGISDSLGAHQDWIERLIDTATAHRARILAVEQSNHNRTTPAYTTGTAKYLREDSTWVEPAGVGDITAVNVTAPITGGGTYGDVTLALDSTGFPATDFDVYKLDTAKTRLSLNMDTVITRNAKQNDTLSTLRTNITTINSKNGYQDDSLSTHRTNIGTINTKNTTQDDTIAVHRSNINALINSGVDNVARDTNTAQTLLITRALDSIGVHRTAIDGKVGTSRAINSGTGLLGGGNLTVDRTLSLDSTSFLATDYDVSLKFAKTDTTNFKAGLLKNADSTTLKNSLLKNTDSTTLKTNILSQVLKNADSTTLKTNILSQVLKNTDSTTLKTNILSQVLKNADSTTVKTNMPYYLNTLALLDSNSIKDSSLTTDDVNPDYLFNVSATTGRIAKYLTATSIGSVMADGLNITMSSKPITSMTTVDGIVTSIDTPSTVANGSYTNMDATVVNGVITYATNGLSGGSGGGGFDNSFDIQFAGSATSVTKTQSGFHSYDKWWVTALTDSVGATVRSDSLCVYPDSNKVTVKRGTINTPNMWVTLGRIAGTLAVPTGINATVLDSESVRVTWTNPTSSLTSTTRWWDSTAVAYSDTGYVAFLPTSNRVIQSKDSTGITVTGLVDSTLYYFNVFTLTKAREVSANQAGSRDTTTTLSSIVATADSISPDSISGLVAWYEGRFITGKSNADTMGTWVDHTANLYNLTTRSSNVNPTYSSTGDNGRPTVTFTAGNNHLMENLTIAPTLDNGQPMTVVVRYREPQTIDSTGAQRLWYLGLYSDGDHMFTGGLHASANYIATIKRDAGGMTQVTNDIGRAGTWTKWHTVIFTYDTTGTDTIGLYADSTYSEVLGNNTDYFGLQADRFYVGGAYNTEEGSEFDVFKGNISLVYVYNRSLSLTERRYIFNKIKNYYDRSASW